MPPGGIFASGRGRITTRENPDVGSDGSTGCNRAKETTGAGDHKSTTKYDEPEGTKKRQRKRTIKDQVTGEETILYLSEGNTRSCPKSKKRRNQIPITSRDPPSESEMESEHSLRSYSDLETEEEKTRSKRNKNKRPNRSDSGSEARRGRKDKSKSGSKNKSTKDRERPSRLEAEVEVTKILDSCSSTWDFEEKANERVETALREINKNLQKVNLDIE